MSIGKSGRIVIEIDPSTKRRLYSQLTANGLSLKDWFSEAVEDYLKRKGEKGNPRAREGDNDEK
jgi:predicted HicB family RNase H-like nuclease